MPDISMCKNETCPIKKKCYRYTATPSDFRQSYSNFSPDASPEMEGCSYFWDNSRFLNKKHKMKSIDKRSKSWKQAKKVVYETNKTFLAEIDSQEYKDWEHQQIMDAYKIITKLNQEDALIKIMQSDEKGGIYEASEEHAKRTQPPDDTNIPQSKDSTPTGLGDALETIFEKTGVKKVVEWLTDGKDCGCSERKKKLNDFGIKHGITRRGVNCLLESEYKWIKEYNKRHNPKSFSREDVSKLSRLYIRIFSKRISICTNCNSAIKVLNNMVKDFNKLVDIYEVGEIKELKP